MAIRRSNRLPMETIEGKWLFWVGLHRGRGLETELEVEDCS